MRRTAKYAGWDRGQSLRAGAAAKETEHASRFGSYLRDFLERGQTSTSASACEMLRPAPPPPWLDSNAVVRRISLGQLVVVVIEPGGRRPPHAAQSNRVSCLRRARFGPVMLLLSVGSDSPNDGS